MSESVCVTVSPARFGLIETVIDPTPTKFDFPEPARIAPPILALDRVSVGYDGIAWPRRVPVSWPWSDQMVPEEVRCA